MAWPATVLSVMHLADLHFSADRIEDKKASAEQALRYAEQRKPDLIIVAGDSFDHTVRLEEPAAREAIRWFSKMRRAAPILVIKGNYSHDRNSVEALEALDILVSTEPEVIAFYAGHATAGPFRRTKIEDYDPHQLSRPHALLCTMPYPNAAYLAKVSRLSPDDMKRAISEGLLAIMRGFSALLMPSGVAKIFVFHGTIPDARISKTQHAMGMDIELRVNDIEACGFDLACGGHLHFAQRLGKHTFYPGGWCYTNFGDEGHKGAWLHTFKPPRVMRDDGSMDTCSWGLNPVESEYLPIESVPMVSVAIDFREPFYKVPDVGVADVQIQLQMDESQREALRAKDWKEDFPAARSIQVVPHIEVVASVRSEEVRQAHSLPEKIVAWLHQADMAVPESVLTRAALLEGHDADQLIEMTKEELQ